MTDDGYIGLPPGMTEPSSRRTLPEPTRPKRPEIVFVPTVPGVPAVIPETETEPETEPVFEHDTVAAPAPLVPAALFTPQPVAPAQPAAAPQPQAPPVTVVEDDALADETRMSQPRIRARRWSLDIPGAGRIPVEGVVFLGRNPIAAADAPDALTLALDDSTKSVSKTHARLDLDDGVLFVSDLESTNGVWIVPADGEPIEVLPGTRHIVPEGADLELGEFVIQVERS